MNMFVEIQVLFPLILNPLPQNADKTESDIYMAKFSPSTVVSFQQKQGSNVPLCKGNYSICSSSIYCNNYKNI